MAAGALGLAIAFALWAGPSGHGGNAGGMEVSRATFRAPRTPSEITKVHPPHGSRVCPRPAVGGDLLLTPALRSGAAFDASSVALTLDGRDVTRHALVRGTMDYPQSRATLLYTPEDPLREGPHEAALILPTSSGRTTYRWSFTVARIPCR